MFFTRLIVGLLFSLLAISTQAVLTHPDAGDGKATEVQTFNTILDVDKTDSA